MTKESLIKYLHKRKAEYGSWTALAKSLNLTPQYLQDIKDNRRDPGAKLLTALGMVKTITYQKTPTGSI